MRDGEGAARLVGDVYDAALDAARWPGVLQQIATFVGGQAAGLLSKDAVSRAGSVQFNFGVDDRYIRLYQDEYWQFDPLAPLLFFPVDQVVTATDYLPAAEFYEGRFFREWAMPQGWVDGANVVLEKSATSFSILSVMHQDGCPIVCGTRERMQRIVPHVRRALAIGRAVELKTTQASTLAHTLDGIGAAVFLVDAIGRMVHANTAASALLADGDFMHGRDGRLAVNDPDADCGLNDVVAGNRRGDTKAAAIPLLTRDGRRHVVHVLPLTSGARRSLAAACGAVTALFVQEAALKTPARPEIIARTYGLTPMELRVLLAIVDVGGAPETAEALGIADCTVRTHLVRVYAKTGTRRHADLVRLVAEFASPLAG